MDEKRGSSRENGIKNKWNEMIWDKIGMGEMEEEIFLEEWTRKLVGEYGKMLSKGSGTFCDNK